MCAELCVSLGWQGSDGAWGLWGVVLQEREAVRCECPAGQAGRSSGLAMVWPFLVVAQGHCRDTDTLPVRSLQTPLCAISPGGAPCAIQVVVAL